MLSAVVLTKNEEENIAECLKTLAWCDEIIVLDDYSKDETVKIAEKQGARVFKRNLDNNFAEQRNFGLEKAKGEWVLFVDADERVSAQLRDEIRETIRKSGNLISGYLIKRQDVMWGKVLKHGETGTVRLLRLGNKVGKWSRAVHEVWRIEEETDELRNPIMHYPHQTLRDFVADIDRYSTLHAAELAREGKSANICKIMLWPKFKFLENYLFRLGFLDGGPGFVVAMLMSFHSFLAWSKLWLKEHRAV